MAEELLKEAFQKVKQDIFALGTELSSIKQELLDLKSDLNIISSYLEDMRVSQFEQENTQNTHIENIKIELNDKITQKISEINQEIEEKLSQTNKQTHQQTQIPTHNSENPIHMLIPTDTPTHPQEIEGLISPYNPLSIGNRGVPTDKPTDRQTNQHMSLSSVNQQQDKLNRASELLRDLDSLKKEVRLKFKRLTPQEMQVFSLLYSLEESSEIVDYRVLSLRLSLSESSIRDYILKLEKKGIPIIKEKLNNKRVILHISPELKQIASLNTIIHLRDL